ncbi:helix-turn-helix domain-containing protein [Chitinophagaceae bacterium LWZ2-11]
MHNAYFSKAGYVGKMMGYEPLQFAIGLDLKSKKLLEDLMADNIEDYRKSPYPEGYCIQLMWLFLINYGNSCKVGKKKTQLELDRIISLKESIEKNIDEARPSLAYAAAYCLMSKSKFADLFKTIYGNNYASYFLNLKMERAKELLDQGNKVMYTGNKIGYVGIGQFSKLFKAYTGYTPAKYKSRAK